MSVVEDLENPWYGLDKPVGKMEDTIHIHLKGGTVTDYKQLLTKYIEHVGECEGVDFIPKYVGKKHPVKSYIETGKPFTKEELEVLWNCTGWDEEEGTYK